ncbi:MAG: DUF6531 domain-containing protein [Christensenellaceae bacterium]|jgi:RHS repeat-associated protein|nr:DUF6531 domain-containing protein [Christensenellaceae bacterium]
MKKYHSINAGRAGNAGIDLATGNLEFVHEDTRSDSSILPISISHVYASNRALNDTDTTYGRGFKLNLHQTLTHRDGDDTKWKLTDASGTEHRFKERYYYWGTENGKDIKIFTDLKSADIEIGFDGKLTCKKAGTLLSKEVFAQVRTKSGLTLHTDLKNFKGRERHETRHEEVVKLEEEIKNLTRHKEDLEYSLLESPLREMQKQIEGKSIELEKFVIIAPFDTTSDTTLISIKNNSYTPKQIFDAVTNVNSMTIAKRQEYMLAIKERYQELLRKLDRTLINRITSSNITSDMEWWVGTSFDMNYNNQGFTYNDTDGRMADHISADIVWNDNSNHRTKGLALFQQKFNDKIERLSQKINELSMAMENKSWADQKTMMAKKSTLIALQEEYMTVKNLQQDAHFTRIVARAQSDIETVQTMIAYKSYMLGLLTERIPVNYISQDGIVYGFNKAGSLVSIFDNHDNQAAIIYENGRIVKIVDDKDKEIRFNYSKSNGKLTEIIDCQNRKTKFGYTGDLLTKVIYNDNEITFGYQGPLLNQVGNTNITYTANKPTSIRRFDDTTQIEYFGGETRVIDVKTGAKLACYFNSDNELLAEHSKALTMYDLSDNYEFVQQKTSLVGLNITATISEFVCANGARTLSSVQSITDDWSYVTLNDNRQKIGEWYSEKTIEKHTDGAKDGEVRTTNRKAYEYDNDNLVLEESYEIKDNAPEKLVAWQKYEYNKQNKLIRTTDYEGMISETIYDEKGSATKSFTYHKSNPTAKFYSEQATLDDKLAVGTDSHTDGVMAISQSADSEPNNTLFEYDGENLVKLTSRETVYEYTYDAQGRKTSIKVGGEPYVTFEYGENTTTATYANGDVFQTTFDKFSKETAITRNGAPFVSNQYDKDDKLISTVDYTTNKVTNYTYDKDGNVVATSDGEARVTNELNDDLEFDTVYKLHGQVLPATDETVTKDTLGRVTSIKNPIEAQKVTYVQRDDHATNLVSSVTNGNDRVRYKYDDRGNITEIRDGFNRQLASYEYDELSRLTRENDTEIGYDNNGNILYRKNGDDITEYRYNGDKLVSYNSELCEYDKLSNPSLYRDKNLGWDFRNLVRFDDVEFKYNANGLRITKQRGEVTTKYYWAGDRLLGETRSVETCGVELGEYPADDAYCTAQRKEIRYVYGDNGISGFTLNNTSYHYRKNIMGDVTHVFDNDGTVVAEYKYDAFGNFEIVKNENGIAELNPILYRGYYFDHAVGMYYLKSRWYDCSTARFINMDILDELRPNEINGLNLFSYCGNNPIMNIDESGRGFWKNLWRGITTTIGAIVGGIMGAVAGFATGGILGVVVGGVFCAVTGGIYGYAIGSKVSLNTANNIFGYLDDTFGVFSATFEKVQSIGKTLGKVGGVLTGITFGLNVLSVLVSNFTNPNFSRSKKWLYSLADITYSALTLIASVTVAATISLIPVAGPVLGAFVGMGIAYCMTESYNRAVVNKR